MYMYDDMNDVIYIVYNVIWASEDQTELRIYSTTIPAVDRRATWMNDRQYRLAIAWQNVAYNQPPHSSF